MISNKQIAKQLRLEAYRVDNWSSIDAFIGGLIKFKFDNMTIKCKANSEAILAVAEKFEKRQPSYGTVCPRRPALTRPKFSLTTLRRFTTEGDLEGAKAYAVCYGHLYKAHIIYRPGHGDFAQYYNTQEGKWKTSRFVNSEIVTL